ncbi:hypothetical protein ACFWY9_11015 [Amycolatopsis sp. NPDC059027]|uniref:hypothetical protein n=1 Tax=unclassified Amycolatopsis TaxID=2618356 RepID=UPI00366C33CA
MSRYPAIQGELEDELSRELEDEFESEVGGLAHELEDELEDEAYFEYEDEDEFEDEVGGLAHELEDELEDEAYFEYEDEDEAEAEFETLVRELETEFELEGEDFSNPARRIYSDAEMMAQLAFQAENAESEEEAEAFLGALAPLAFQAAKWAAPHIAKYAPKIIRGAVNLGKKLWSRPATRAAVRQVPKILGRTVRTLGKHYAAGRPIDAHTVSRALVGHAVHAADHSRHQQRRHRGRPQQRRRGHRPAHARRHGHRRQPVRARARGGSRQRRGRGRARRR